MRRGLAWALAAAGAVAVAEMVAFVLAARWIGAAWALLLVLAVSLLGAALLRREGVRAWQRFRAAAQAGRPPGTQVVDGLVGLAGGLLLALPGLLTGLVGLVLLVPPVRRLVRARVARTAERRLSPAAVGDLFGPRRVRVRHGEPWPGKSDPPDQPGPTIEGEVIGPADRERPPA